MNTPSASKDTEYNKQFIIRHFEEFVNNKNSAVALQNMTPDFLDHDEACGPVTGAEAAKTMMEGMYRMLPDIHVSIEDIIAEDDKVMVRNIWTGTTQDGKKSNSKVLFYGDYKMEKLQNAGLQ